MDIQTNTVAAHRAAPKKKGNKISRRENNWHGWVFIGPYALIFSVFILIPVILAAILSFTNFNAIQFPEFIGFLNYITILTNDAEFMKYVLPNTVVYAVIVGIGGYVLSFLLAWALCNLTKPVRTFFALVLYSPSMTTGVGWAATSCWDSSGSRPTARWCARSACSGTKPSPPSICKPDA